MKKQIVESLGTFRLFLVELRRRLAYAGDMFSIAFFPAYTGLGASAKALFAEMKSA